MSCYSLNDHFKSCLSVAKLWLFVGCTMYPGGLTLRWLRTHHPTRCWRMAPFFWPFQSSRDVKAIGRAGVCLRSLRWFSIFSWDPNLYLFWRGLKHISNGVFWDNSESERILKKPLFSIFGSSGILRFLQTHSFLFSFTAVLLSDLLELLVNCASRIWIELLVFRVTTLYQ